MNTIWPRIWCLHRGYLDVFKIEIFGRKLEMDKRLWVNDECRLQAHPLLYMALLH